MEDAVADDPVMVGTMHRDAIVPNHDIVRLPSVPIETRGADAVAIQFGDDTGAEDRIDATQLRTALWNRQVQRDLLRQRITPEQWMSTRHDRIGHAGDGMNDAASAEPIACPTGNGLRGGDLVTEQRCAAPNRQQRRATP